MKTPQDWICEVPVGVEEDLTKLITLVEAIQKDAFELGRLKGLNEAGELCESQEQTKTEYMIRLHNLIHENSQIVVTPKPDGE